MGDVKWLKERLKRVVSLPGRETVRKRIRTIVNRPQKRMGEMYCFPSPFEVPEQVVRRGRVQVGRRQTTAFAPTRTLVGAVESPLEAVVKRLRRSVVPKVAGHIPRRDPCVPATRSEAMNVADGPRDPRRLIERLRDRGRQGSEPRSHSRERKSIDFFVPPRLPPSLTCRAAI